MIDKIKNRLDAFYDSLEYRKQIQFVVGMALVAFFGTWLASGEQTLDAFIKDSAQIREMTGEEDRLAKIVPVSKKDFQFERILSLRKDIKEVEGRFIKDHDFDISKIVLLLPSDGKIDTLPATNQGNGLVERRLSISFSDSWENIRSVLGKIAEQTGADIEIITISSSGNARLAVRAVFRTIGKDETWETLQ